MKVLGYPLDAGPPPARLRVELYVRALRAKARSWRRPSERPTEAAG
jgi:hypothetical protein